MKPLRLELQAFGSFSETADVDFERLDGRKLFLIHGPTGSGKSTLFDAMCYALYGVTSGIRDGKEMRSKQAEDDLETVVRFTFQIGEETFFVERKPPYIKTGNKNETPHKATFYRLNSRGIPAEEPLVKVSEVNERLKSILGFDEKQFVQLIMLPQGEFRRLLLSSTDEREAILARLFKTGLYERISLKLAEKSKDFRKKYVILDQKIATLLNSLELNSREELQEKIQNIGEDLNSKNKILSDLQKEFREKSEQLEKGRQLAVAFRDYEMVKKSIDLHGEQKEHIEKLDAKLKEAEKAESFRIPVLEIEKLENKIPVARERIEKLEKDLKIKTAELSESKKVVEKMKSQSQEWEQKKTTIQRFKDFIPVLEKKDELIIKEGKQKESVQKLDNQILEWKNELEQIQETLKKQEEKLPALEKEAGQNTIIENDLKSYQRATESRKHLKEKEAYKSKLEKEIENLFDELSEAGDKKSKLISLFQDKDLQWRKNQAALLAKDMNVGEACPVCGSKEHPNPAPIPDELVTNDEYDQLKSEKDAVEKKYDEIKNHFEWLKNEKEKTEISIRTYREQLGELSELTELDWQIRGSSLQKSLESAQKAEKELEGLRGEKARMLKSQIEKQENINGQSQKLNQLQRELFITTGNLENIESELPDDLGSLEVLQSRIGELEKDITKFEKKFNDVREKVSVLKEKSSELKARIEQGQSYLKESEQDLANRQKKLLSDIQKAGFNRIEDITQSLFDEGKKSEFQKNVEDWHNEKIRLHTESDRLKKIIEDKSEPDMNHLSELASEAEKKLNGVKEQITRLDEQVRYLESVRKQVHDAEKQLIEIQEKAGDYLVLADIANGKNRYNQKFQTFVLSFFLDEVTQLANERLKLMSQDRYELIRTEDISHGLRKAGLDLNVFDNYNGEERSVRTLSGGEMFITSLALALGLADVAMQYAGGLKIDAMFIDEGFGSLDSETLDLAVRTLMNLEEDGRLVGIISHVEELKERIDTRLEVVKRQEGSRLKWHIN